MWATSIWHPIAQAHHGSGHHARDAAGRAQAEGPQRNQRSRDDLRDVGSAILGHRIMHFNDVLYNSGSPFNGVLYIQAPARTQRAPSSLFLRFSKQ